MNWPATGELFIADIAQLGGGWRAVGERVARAPFEVMQPGEKQAGFRSDTDWIRSRLYQRDGEGRRHYDYIELSCGYTEERPKLLCRLTGFRICQRDETATYSSGLKCSVAAGDFILGLGDIVERRNVGEF